MNKIKVGLGIVGGVIMAGIASFSAFAETMSSSTLGTKIDTINTTSMDFIGVLIDKYWPFLLGLVILVSVWAFGKKIIHHFM